ncbi:MAG: FRG domain-containing protein [Elusimicrobiaceae bacterium]|nr:FRG domain-containing protein [Elusimicrobiaceae bacterium]
MKLPATNILETIECISWNEFKQKLPSIESKCIKLADNTTFTPMAAYFRGQADAKWELKTTLERETHFELYSSCKDYISLLNKIDGAIKSIHPESPKFDYKNHLDKSHMLFSNNDLLEYFAFVRHLGFPSPLLDWSRSPYVAAFFAFNTCDPTAVSNVAIYVLYNNSVLTHEQTSGIRGTTFLFIGEYLRTHKRHYIQQSNYTLALESSLTKDNATYKLSSEKFVPYIKTFECDNSRNYLKKYILPSSERNIALKDLDKMNINSFSLYESDEALMKTLFNREVLFKD